MKSPEPSRDYIQGTELGLPLVAQVRTLRSRGATRLTWHSHACHELTCILEGASEYELAGGETLKVAGGHFLLIPAGVSHRAAHDARTPVTLCGIQFNPSQPGARTLTPFSPREFASLCACLKDVEPTVRAYSPMMQRSLEQFLREKDSRLSEPIAPLTWPALRMLVCAILLEAVRLVRQSEDRHQQVYAQATKTFLARRLDRPFNLPELIRHLGISRTRLFTVFKAETGLTPNDFFVRCRVEEAQRLLVETKRPITEIALEIGFNSSQYFSRAFRRYTGVSPAAYRRSNSSPARAEMNLPQDHPAPHRASAGPLARTAKRAGRTAA